MPTHLKIASVARLWRLALPLIIANIATPLLGLADAAISGHLDHTYYLAAVTVGAELLVIFFGTFSFLFMLHEGISHFRDCAGCSEALVSFRVRGRHFSLSFSRHRKIIGKFIGKLLPHNKSIGTNTIIIMVIFDNFMVKSYLNKRFNGLIGFCRFGLV